MENQKPDAGATGGSSLSPELIQLIRDAKNKYAGQRLLLRDELGLSCHGDEDVALAFDVLADIFDSLYDGTRNVHKEMRALHDVLSLLARHLIAKDVQGDAGEASYAAFEDEFDEYEGVSWSQAAAHFLKTPRP